MRSATDREGVSGKAEDIKIIDIQYNNQVRKN